MYVIAILKYCIVLITLLIFNFTGISTVDVLNPYIKALKLLVQREPPTNLTQFSEKYVQNVEELWLEQKLDHFSRNQSIETWSMRYMRNSKYLRPNGPIFIFVGGEWEISQGHLLTGLMHDVAVQHGGILFYTEHRFYGQSWPKGDASIENLRFLNVHQALADLAYFIRYQKQIDLNLKQSKVILVGGSYSGSMVAWFTRQYPELADVVWASSAPLRAKLDFNEYLELTGDSIRNQGSELCYQRIFSGMSSLLRIFRSKEGTKMLMKRLHICQNFNATRELDVSTFFNGIGNYFAAIVQSYSTQIGDMCESLVSMDKDPENAIIKYLFYVFWPDSGIQKINDYCFDFTFEAMQSIFSNIHDKKSGSRPWFYQTCNEFGWFTTTATPKTHYSTKRHPFMPQVPLAFFQHLCQTVFGNAFTLPRMVLSIAQTNKHFTNAAVFPIGNDINNNINGNGNYDKVIFTHGQLDPWRAVGQQIGRNVIVIPGYSHTADLASIDLNDSVEMNVAKLQVAAFMQRALRQ